MVVSTLKKLIVEVGHAYRPLVARGGFLPSGARFVGVELTKKAYEKRMGPKQSPMASTYESESGAFKKFTLKQYAKSKKVFFVEASGGRLPFKKNSVSEIHFNDVFVDPRTTSKNAANCIRSSWNALKRNGLLVVGCGVYDVTASKELKRLFEKAREEDHVEMRKRYGHQVAVYRKKEKNQQTLKQS